MISPVRFGMNQPPRPPGSPKGNQNQNIEYTTTTGLPVEHQKLLNELTGAPTDLGIHPVKPKPPTKPPTG